jgi:transcriptional regulator with XRE-family HTH domain
MLAAMETENPMDRLFARARANKITMKRICAAAGVDKSTPSRWRSGQYSPRLDTVMALNAALDRLIEASQTGKAA